MADGNVAKKPAVKRTQKLALVSSEPNVMKAEVGEIVTHDFAKKLLEAAFPIVDPGVEPLGNRILIQIRVPKAKSGNIHIPDSARDTEKWNTQIGKVIALGPTAYRNLRTLEPWPEGSHVVPGDFVRIGKYGGDRFEVKQLGKDNALFVVMLDHEMIAKVTGDPLAIVAFV